MHKISQHTQQSASASNNKSTEKREGKTGLEAESTEAVNVNQELNLSRAEKLKKAVKEYGSTVIVFHIGISLISLGTCYALVSS